MIPLKTLLQLTFGKITESFTVMTIDILLLNLDVFFHYHSLIDCCGFKGLVTALLHLFKIILFMHFILICWIIM